MTRSSAITMFVYLGFTSANAQTSDLASQLANAKSGSLQKTIESLKQDTVEGRVYWRLDGNNQVTTTIGGSIIRLRKYGTDAYGINISKQINASINKGDDRFNTGREMDDLKSIYDPTFRKLLGARQSLKELEHALKRTEH